ncbi:hypothetical protein SLG_25270 [Sphingobium sp. SYK-6]|uniref:DUF2087 domain-containing protein n=1 Tax=Sphingobium sp. (strain NBRC 103272 / SYK-6) TaxID=627192 RepID=UPI0002277604|nr:DUF2087 domain-containing protein [Sphingobium sp. SYK-6]BAK67202.1 hypothetical protein SLG_25270 [Sphingobium sp. SYK-6]
MSRTILPFAAPDFSALARSLRQQLVGRTAAPGHLELMNMLARAAGSRNYQHYRAQALTTPAPQAHAAPPATHDIEAADTPPVRPERLEKALRCFDRDGRLTRWPARTVLQHLCLWPLWADFPPARTLDEKQVNDYLKSRNSFLDHAILRREMCNIGLLSRTRDGRAYRRLERRPPPEALMMIRLQADKCRKAG